MWPELPPESYLLRPSPETEQAQVKDSGSVTLGRAVPGHQSAWHELWPFPMAPPCPGETDLGRDAWQEASSSREAACIPSRTVAPAKKSGTGCEKEKRNSLPKA